MSDNDLTDPPTEHILQFFTYTHLAPHLQLISKPFCELAHAIVMGDNVPESGNCTFGSPLPRNPERTVALRKLLEAKDAAVRALVAKHDAPPRADHRRVPWVITATGDGNMVTVARIEPGFLIGRDQVAALRDQLDAWIAEYPSEEG
jgi:hypothetical protein